MRGRALPGWLIALLGASFVLYTDDYVIAGVLPEIAADLRVSEAIAGQLVTVFSFTIAVAAPIAAIALARLPRRLLFMIAFIVFSIANALAALTPSYEALVLLRVVSALAAASATPSLFAFAASHAPEGRTGRYLAVVSLGVTGSITAGVPLGTWIGSAFGWRFTFAAMAVAGLAILVVLMLLLPRTARPDGHVGLVEQLRTLKRRAVVLGLLANCALMTGSMMMLTYLASYLAAVSGAGPDERAFAFALSGAAGMAGIWLGGVATDRWGPDRTLLFGVAVIVAAMTGLWSIWLARPVPIPVVLAVATVWGGIAFWNSPAIQTRLYALAGPVAPQALALNTSGTYLGVSIGAAVGGIALAGSGVGSLPLLAAAFAICALLLLGGARTVAARTA